MSVDGYASPFLRPTLNPSLCEVLSCNVHEFCRRRCDNTPLVVNAIDVSDDGPNEGGSDDNEMGRLFYVLDPPSAEESYTPERAEPLIVDSSLPRFRYSPTPSNSRHVRLLKIKPAVFLADPLDCELIDVNLDSAPPFDAVSYCWGEPGEMRSIMINGQQHRIQPSLDDTLHRYRRLGGTLEKPLWKGKAEYVWADGICIDQRNLEEKMEQVVMMHDIYKQARRVFIDLGDTPDLWICALDLMHAINDSRRQLSRGVVGPEQLSLYGLPPLGHIAWPALGYIFQQPWFRRTWIVQEMAVPERQPLVMFGRYSFTLDIFSVAVDFLANQGYIDAVQGTAPNRQEGFLNATKMFGVRIEHQAGKTRCLPLVERMRDFLATDPRDKVYGIMSLLTEEDRLLPNYREPIEEVYAQFAVRRIERGDGARLLDSAGLQRRLSEPVVGLPSWAPDWRAQFRHPRIISNLRQFPYGASGSMDSKFTLLKDEEGKTTKLQVEAAIVDTIDYVCDVWSGGYVSEFLDIVTQAQALAKSKPATVERYTDPADAFARCLLMDDLYEEGKNTIRVFTEITHPAKTLDEILADRTVLEGQSANGVMTDIGTFRTQSETACLERRFAGTVTGYIGVVPRGAVPGDVICVTAGASVPHVLRPTAVDGEYVFIGDAYVHGLMYGEVLQLKEAPFGELVLV